MFASEIIGKNERGKDIMQYYLISQLYALNLDRFWGPLILLSDWHLGLFPWG
jgi:hypothetical protein